jgi:hypothetical protein
MDKGATYVEDVFIWSQRQAALLRELARAGVALPNELDLPNIAEEIEDVGRSELNSVLSHLEEMLIHAIKAASRPDAEPYCHWLNEIDAHQAALLRHFTPGMRQQIDLGASWRRARKRAERALLRFDEMMASMPDELPFALEQLLGEDFAAETLVLHLRAPRHE